MSIEHTIDYIRTLIDDHDALFEIKMTLPNNNVMHVIVSRIGKQTYLVTIWYGGKRKSRYLQRYTVYRYLNQLINNMKPSRVIVNDLRRE